MISSSCSDGVEEAVSRATAKSPFIIGKVEVPNVPWLRVKSPSPLPLMVAVAPIPIPVMTARAVCTLEAAALAWSVNAKADGVLPAASARIASITAA